MIQSVKLWEQSIQVFYQLTVFVTSQPGRHVTGRMMLFFAALTQHLVLIG